MNTIRIVLINCIITLYKIKFTMFIVNCVLDFQIYLNKVLLLTYYLYDEVDNMFV